MLSQTRVKPNTKKLEISAISKFPMKIIDRFRISSYTRNYMTLTSLTYLNFRCPYPLLPISFGKKEKRFILLHAIHGRKRVSGWCNLLFMSAWLVYHTNEQSIFLVYYTNEQSSSSSKVMHCPFCQPDVSFGNRNHKKYHLSSKGNCIVTDIKSV